MSEAVYAEGHSHLSSPGRYHRQTTCTYRHTPTSASKRKSPNGGLYPTTKVEAERSGWWPCPYCLEAPDA